MHSYIRFLFSTNHQDSNTQQSKRLCKYTKKENWNCQFSRITLLCCKCWSSVKPTLFQCMSYETLCWYWYAFEHDLSLCIAANPVGRPSYSPRLGSMDTHTLHACGDFTKNPLIGSAIFQVLRVFMTSCTSIVKSRRRGCFHKSSLALKSGCGEVFWLFWW